MKKHFTRISILTISSCLLFSFSLLDISKDEIIKGLKEALNIGVETAVKSSSKTDGFWKNELIKLPFPEEAIRVKNTALKLGMSNQVNTFETTLNRAAEEATKEALPIFVNAIKSLSIQDGISILNGGEGAATKYLEKNSTNQLYTAFIPKVKLAIEKVQLTKYWNPLASKYNKTTRFTGESKINTDLNDYVTKRAISGLFKLVEIEENKIRKDPKAAMNGLTNTATETVTKIFGSILKP
jgi:hypothetical protein